MLVHLLDHTMYSGDMTCYSKQVYHFVDMM